MPDLRRINSIVFMKRKHILLIVLLVLTGSGYFVYQWANKPVVEMVDAVCKSRLSATELFNDFSTRETYADSCYSGQVIEVFGKVRSLSLEGPNKSIILETNDMLFGIDCAIDSTNHQKLTSLKEGQDIEIRGECSGILSDVIMVRCIIL